MPFDFLLDYLPAQTVVVPAIGMFYLYLNGKIIFIFRKTGKNPQHNGIWIAALRGAQDDLKAEIPGITDFVFDDGQTIESGWVLLSDAHDDFETSAIALCELAARGDHRIGRITPKAVAITKRG